MMATGLALVVLLLLAVILLLLIDRAGMKAELQTQRELIVCIDKVTASQRSLIKWLRASHDEVQDVALRALRGDLERRTDR